MINENTPTLLTERLCLRKFIIDDIQSFFEIMSNEQVNIFLPWFTLKNQLLAEEFLKTMFLDYYDYPSSYGYAICLKEDNKPIGYVCLGNDESNDFGYGLREEFWGKGIVTEASIAVIERIHKSGYRYITATHDVNNPKSGKVLKKIGMKYCYSYVELIRRHILVTLVVS